MVKPLLALGAVPLAGRAMPALRSAAAGARNALFGTPARSGVTSFFGGLEVARLVPDDLARVTPGGASGVILGVVGIVGTYVLLEVSD